MALLDLKKLKKTEEKIENIAQCDHLIVGNDIFALEATNLLQDRFPEASIKTLYKGELAKSEQGPKGPVEIRGEHNIKKLKELRPHLEIQEKFPSTIFFKDLKWKVFGGRSKSEKLLWGESFYTEKRVELDYSQLFCVFNEGELPTKIKDSLCHASILKINHHNNLWEVECLNGDRYQCENLYWGEGPWRFYELYEKKGQLTDLFVQFCEGTNAPYSLFIRFEFEEFVTDLAETLFIPLSYTHDWGHFIGEFELTESSNGQYAQFVSFLDKDESSEEEISRKIRILKRNLGKIFPQIKGVEFKEYISLSEKSYGQEIDDKLFARAVDGPFGRGDAAKLSFFGHNSPVLLQEVESEEELIAQVSISHLVRSLIGLDNLKTDK